MESLVTVLNLVVSVFWLEFLLKASNLLLRVIPCLSAIKSRLENYEPILPEIKSGYQKMYIDHVTQADTGADLDFLVGKRGSEVKRHSH